MKERYLTLVWALALAACGGHAEIGSDGLEPPRGRDSSSTLEPMPDIEVTPDSLPKIKHTSALEPIGQATLLSYSLMADRDGTLWEFASELGFPNASTGGQGEGRLRVRTTSLAGDVHLMSVEAPGKPSADNRMDLLHARNEVQGPMVDVTWYPPKCENGDCAVNETLAFSWDPSKPPERKHWSNGNVWAAQVKDRWTFVVPAPTGPVIEQQTRSGEVVWRQTALGDEGYELYSGIDLLETGELAILAVVPHPGETPDLWRIGFDGKVKQRLLLDGLQQGARLLHDSQHRAWATGTAWEQGILVLRHEGGDTLRSWHFLRTQYSELAIFAHSIDLADTLYVLTESGGRLMKDRVSILCRVRADDTAGCFVLERPDGAIGGPFQMQATGPGIVYVGNGERLFRYELPTD